MRFVIAVDATLLPAVQKLVLPDGPTIEPFDAAAPDGVGAEAGALICGLVLPACTEGEEENAATARLRALLPEPLREDGIFFLSRRSEKSLTSWCWQRMRRVLEHLAREYARAHLALATYREREQVLERSLATAEAAFVDFRREPLRLALRLDWSGAYVCPATEGETGQRVVIRQRVPVPVANVIYVDLFFNRDGAGLAGEARVLIHGLYSAAALHESRFPIAAIRQGWKRFRCAAADLVLRQPLGIEIALDGPALHDLMPGLSNPNPIAEDCAEVEGHGPVGRALALQVWCGVAGLAYPRNVTALAAETPAAALETLSVPADALGAATAYAVSRTDIDFAPVSYDGATQSLLVHPLGRMPTVARLSRIAVRNLNSVSVLAHLRHAEAKSTECAILVLPSIDRPPRFDEGSGLLAMANWVRLEGGEWGDVRCSLPKPLSAEVDIYLLTRNQTEIFDLSWAFFRGLQLVCGVEKPELAVTLPSGEPQ